MMDEQDSSDVAQPDEMDASDSGSQQKRTGLRHECHRENNLELASETIFYEATEITVKTTRARVYQEVCVSDHEEFYKYFNVLKVPDDELNKDLELIIDFHIRYGISNTEEPSDSEAELMWRLKKKYAITCGKLPTENMVSLCQVFAYNPLSVALCLKKRTYKNYGTLNGLPKALAFPGGLQMIPKNERWRPLEILWKMWKSSVMQSEVCMDIGWYYMTIIYKGAGFDSNTCMETLQIKPSQAENVFRIIQSNLKINNYDFTYFNIQNLFSLYAHDIWEFYSTQEPRVAIEESVQDSDLSRSLKVSQEVCETLSSRLSRNLTIDPICIHVENPKIQGISHESQESISRGKKQCLLCSEEKDYLGARMILERSQDRMNDSEVKNSVFKNLERGAQKKYLPEAESFHWPSMQRNQESSFLNLGARPKISSSGRQERLKPTFKDEENESPDSISRRPEAELSQWSVMQGNQASSFQNLGARPKNPFSLQGLSKLDYEWEENEPMDPRSRRSEAKCCKLTKFQRRSSIELEESEEESPNQIWRRGFISRKNFDRNRSPGSKRDTNENMELVRLNWDDPAGVMNTENRIREEVQRFFSQYHPVPYEFWKPQHMELSISEEFLRSISGGDTRNTSDNIPYYSTTENSDKTD